MTECSRAELLVFIVHAQINEKPVRPEYSCSLWKINMVKAMDGREFNNVAEIPCSYGTTIWCVVIQGLVCSPRMAVT